MTYKIDKATPMPEYLGNKNATKYPFERMEVGDSFLAETDRAGAAAHAYGKRHDKKFVFRREGKKYRVWRVK